MTDQPRTIGSGGILVRDGKVLLGLRSKELKFYPNVWDVFGGHCEVGESEEEALVRELEEELGICPIRFELLASVEEPNPEKHGEGRYQVYAISEWEGDPENLGKEHQIIRWFNLAELQDIDLASSSYLEIFKSLA